MTKNVFGTLPEEIRSQIDGLIADTATAAALVAAGDGLPGDDASLHEVLREQLAANWLAKFELWESQSHLLGLEDCQTLAPEDGRALIALTYSGSLISLGPSQTGGSGEKGGRSLEYASIKLRSDVPSIVSGDGACIIGAPARDQPLRFSSGPLQATSKLYRIAVCPERLDAGEQEKRIREAGIFITNGFIKLNRDLTMTRQGGAPGGAEQFTLNAMARYLAGKNGLTIARTRQLMDDFLSTIESGLLLGERVSLGRLGRLSLKLRPPRKARVVKNPRTGEDILIPARGEVAAPGISFSSSLKDRVSLVDPRILAGEDEEGDDQD